MAMLERRRYNLEKGNEAFQEMAITEPEIWIAQL